MVQALERSPVGLTSAQTYGNLWEIPPCPPRLLPEILNMVRAFERESRIRELIQLFVRERDPEKLKILAAELQRLLTLEGTVPKIWRE